MDFGICVAAKIDDVGYITHAENLGYSHAWVADSQMIWSDCYAVLALAAPANSHDEHRYRCVCCRDAHSSGDGA